MESVSVSIVQNHEAIVREMITREDELTNQRMLWMAAFNGLLFASFGFAWDKTGARFLEIVLSCLGVATSLLTGLALVFAAHAQRRLLKWWHKSVSKTYHGPGVMGVEPTDMHHGALSIFFAPWILLAVAFIAGWAFILHFVWKYVH
jgi:hypothetical protein